MKRLIAVFTSGLLAAALLAACGGSSSSSVPASSSQAVSSAPSQAVSSGSVGAGSSAAALYDVNDLAATLAEAATLGNTISMIELDLKAGGMDVVNIAEFAGLKAQNSAENGGIVIVIRAVAGAAETVKGELEGFKQASMGNEDYTEFETARDNTAEARIQVNGDYVVYAVSATGHEGGWPQLDDALASLFN